MPFRDAVYIHIRKSVYDERKKSVRAANTTYTVHGIASCKRCRWLLCIWACYAPTHTEQAHNRKPPAFIHRVRYDHRSLACALVRSKFHLLCLRLSLLNVVASRSFFWFTLFMPPFMFCVYVTVVGVLCCNRAITLLQRLSPNLTHCGKSCAVTRCVYQRFLFSHAIININKRATRGEQTWSESCLNILYFVCKWKRVGFTWYGPFLFRYSLLRVFSHIFYPLQTLHKLEHIIWSVCVFHWCVETVDSLELRQCVRRIKDTLTQTHTCIWKERAATSPFEFSLLLRWARSVRAQIKLSLKLVKQIE